MTHECGNACFLASFHDLRVALVVGGDEDNLCVPRFVRLPDELHHVWTTATQLRVPQAEAFRADVVVDESRDGRTKRSLLIRSDPDEVPVRALETSGKGSAESGTSAYPNASLVERRGVRHTGKLEFARPDSLRWKPDKASGEVALNSSNKVVILGVTALTKIDMS
jgi:phage terminase large subunit-like protein